MMHLRVKKIGENRDDWAMARVIFEEGLVGKLRCTLWVSRQECG